MAIDVRLTNAQAFRLCEVVGRLEHADFRTLAALHLDGTDLRTLRNAAVRILVPLVEQTDVFTSANAVTLAVEHRKLFETMMSRVRSDGKLTRDYDA